MKTLTTIDLNAELTALNEAARIARTLANITRRAETLFTEGGYKYRQYTENLFVVESPKEDKYVVWHGAETGYACSCLCFDRLNTCKHLEAIDLMKKEAAQSAQADADFERAEEVKNFFGFDRSDY